MAAAIQATGGVDNPFRVRTDDQTVVDDVLDMPGLAHLQGEEAEQGLAAKGAMMSDHTHLIRADAGHIVGAFGSDAVGAKFADVLELRAAAGNG